MEAASVTRQKGPFKYDVYMGFGVCDLPRKMELLQKKLEHHGIICYPKYNAAFRQQRVKSAIDEGVGRSKKCLLYVSPAFIEDQWYKYEVAEVTKKAERFSRDMVVILKDPQVPAIPSELNEYCSDITSVVPDVNNLEFLNKLKAVLTKGTTCLCSTEKCDN